jgi:hypothetical protein
MNKDIHSIFESYLKGSKKNVSTEPELITKHTYTTESNNLSSKDRITYEYHIRSNGRVFSFVLPLHIKKSGEVEVLEEPGWKGFVFLLLKKIKYAHNATGKQAIPLSAFYFNDRGSFNMLNLNRYEALPALELFYELINKDIKEHNNKSVFGDDTEAEDTFSDLYNEL